MAMQPESNQQVVPVLTLHKTAPDQYLLRMYEVSKNISLVSLLVQQLPGIRQLIIVTPLDTKVFNVPNGQPSQRAATAEPDPHPIPSSQPDELADDFDPMAAALALAEEAERPVSSTEDETPAQPSRRRRSSAAPLETPCGRCQGSGEIRTLMEGGEPANASCPVCRGTGQSVKFGMGVRNKK